jgi:hypothetical protein
VDTVGLGPTAHDKGIVVGNDDNIVNTLGLELVDVLKIRWDVGGTAGRGESARHRDKDDLLVLEFYSELVW